MADNKKEDEEEKMTAAAQALIWKAKVAETAEVYDQMCNYMKDAIEANGNKLNDKGRNLFAVAFKNHFGEFRSRYRELTGINVEEMGREEQPEKQKAKTDAIDVALKEMKKNLQDILEEKAKEILDILNNLLNAIANDDGKKPAKITYNKMVGDYNRYRAEYLKNDGNVLKNAREAYEEARKLAEEHLKPTDPVRLGLMLNISVFYYEVDGEQEKAKTLAKDAFDKAIEKLDSLKHDSYKDSTLIMQLLRDNLALWGDANTGAGLGEIEEPEPKF